MKGRRKEPHREKAEKDRGLTRSLVGLQLSELESDDATCPNCGDTYSAKGGLWVCCDGCDQWYDLKCTSIKNKEDIPDTYLCEKCV